MLKETKNFQIADKVANEITNSVKILKLNWNIFEVDEMRIPIDQNYRTFEKLNYRISYKIATEIIYIIRVPHTRRKLKFHK